MPVGTEERCDNVNLYLSRQPGLITRAAFLSIDFSIKHMAYNSDLF